MIRTPAARAISRAVTAGVALAALALTPAQAEPPSRTAGTAPGPVFSPAGVGLVDAGAARTATAAAPAPAQLVTPATQPDTTSADDTTSAPAPEPRLSAFLAPTELYAAPDAPRLSTMDRTSGISSRLAKRGTDWRLGSSFSGQVLDLETGQQLWGRNTSTARIPASTNKVVTAYTAVTSLGADATIATPVLQDPTYPWVIYLQGGGDPSLSFTRLKTLAASTASVLKAQGVTEVSLKVDDTLFPTPTNATGWKSGYVPYDVAPVRPLVVGSRNVWDTSMDAASYFEGYLEANGVAVSWTTRKKAVEGSKVVASTSSAPVRSIVAGMLNVSQNDYAEVLLRTSAAKRGYPTGWTGATTNARDLLASAGVPLSGWAMYDGSGLSRSNRMPAATLNQLLRRIALDPTLEGVFLPSSSLPVSGVSGTLSSRFSTTPSVCARRVIHAKTGTLNDTVALAGVARGVDGRKRVFTYIGNGLSSVSYGRAGVDSLASTATGCW